MTSSSDSRQWAQRELGCNPCEEVDSASASGGVRTYLMNREQVVGIALEEIRDVQVKEVDGEVLVFAEISTRAETQLKELSRSLFDDAASFVDGKFIGVVPMRVAASIFLVGTFGEKPEAEGVARALGWKSQ